MSYVSILKDRVWLQEEGLEALHALVEDADVWLTNIKVDAQVSLQFTSMDSSCL